MLIGYFRLDPNRVLDLLLEAFEMVRLCACSDSFSCEPGLIELYRAEPAQRELSRSH